MVTFLGPQLSNEFINNFEISEVHETLSGGQKHVFIITRKNEKYALKVFINYGAREIRELKIYEKFKWCKDIPKVCSIEDYENDKVVFEEYIEGENLHDVFTKYKYDTDKVKYLIKRICEILNPFWKENIVHRDIKPSNIIIKLDDSPTIIDFGIARVLGDESITDTGAPQPGSWKFAAPEQYFGKKELIDYRSDFFSISVLAYYLYYNKLPFGNKQEEIANNYKKNILPYSTDPDCFFNSLFENCFKKITAERPRNPETLIKLVT